MNEKNNFKFEKPKTIKTSQQHWPSMSQIGPKSASSMSLVERYKRRVEQEKNIPCSFDLMMGRGITERDILTR